MEGLHAPVPGGHQWSVEDREAESAARVIPSDLTDAPACSLVVTEMTGVGHSDHILLAAAVKSFFACWKAPSTDCEDDICRQRLRAQWLAEMSRVSAEDGVDPDVVGVIVMGDPVQGPGIESVLSAHSDETRGVVNVLDLRNGKVFRWVVSPVDVDPAGEARVGESPGISVDRWRKLLAAYPVLSERETSRAARHLGCTPERLTDHIDRVLGGREPLPAPLTEYDRELLRKAYVHGQSADRVAADLHVSRATYYRHLRRALERFQRALRKGYSQPTPQHVSGA